MGALPLIASTTLRQLLFLLGFRWRGFTAFFGVMIMCRLLRYILLLLLHWAPHAFASTCSQVRWSMSICCLDLNYLFYSIIGNWVQQIEPLLLQVLPRLDVNVVEVFLEVSIFKQLFIHGWRQPWVLVDGHAKDWLHQYPKNLHFCNLRGVLYGPVGGKLCSL